MKKIKEICIFIPVFIVAFGVLFFIWQTSDGVLFRKPLVFSKDAVTTQKIYHQGDTVSAKFNYCKRRNLVGTVSWQLIDGYIIEFPERKYSGSMGCFKNKIVVIGEIPLNVPDDTYYFSGIFTFAINGFNTVNVPIKTNKFKVQ